MSETPFFPEPPSFGLPAPLQPKSEPDEAQTLRAMEEDYARTRARQEAFARAYKQIREKLIKFARRLKAGDKAEDFVHDVMTRVWINDLTGPCAGDERCIEAYLKEAVKNRIIDEFREQGLKRETPIGRIESVVTWVTRADVTSQRADGDDVYRLIHRLMWKMPPRRREVFFARCIVELSRAQTAALLGISEKTVAAQLTAALFFLRKEIGAPLGLDNAPELLHNEKEATP